MCEPAAPGTVYKLQTDWEYVTCQEIQPMLYGVEVTPTGGLGKMGDREIIGKWEILWTILQMQSNSKGGEGYIKVDWGKLEEKGWVEE